MHHEKLVEAQAKATPLYKPACKIALVVGAASMLLLSSGCGLQPSEDTMLRQQRLPSWFGPSVRDKVYDKSVREHVYSKEVITPP